MCICLLSEAAEGNRCQNPLITSIFGECSKSRILSCYLVILYILFSQSAIYILVRRNDGGGGAVYSRYITESDSLMANIFSLKASFKVLFQNAGVLSELCRR